MAKTKSEAIAEIEAYVEDCGWGTYGWYVGITKDPADRLFKGHKVKKDGDLWIYRKVASAKIAREIEKYFLDRSYSGGGGGGDDDSVYVYAYKITISTEEG